MESLTKDEREFFKSLRKALRAKFQAEGHGSQKRVLEQLGITKAAFDSAFNRGSVKVLMLKRILGALEIDLAGFFSEGVAEIERVPPSGVPPRGVQIVRERRAQGDFDD